MQHHQDSIAAFVSRIQQDERVLGVIVDGSVASGRERPDSDVDLVLIMTEEAFTQAWNDNRLMYVDRRGITYEGGYYDVKLGSVDYLRRAADNADDPTRAALQDARVVWSRIDGLEGLLAAVGQLPDEVWEQRMASFIAQVRLHQGYFLRQAVEHDNHFLLHHAATHLVGAGGRALLALNRTFYQGQKYLDQTLARLDRIPEGYAEAARSVLDDPGPRTGGRYSDLLESYHRWPLSQEETLSTFLRGNELSWFSHELPTEYS